MSRRASTAAACTGCLLHPTLCICTLVPRLETRTRLVLLLHRREARKPSNTGQLAARCLARSSVVLISKGDASLEPPRVESGELPLLLFPAADALPIEHYAPSPVIPELRNVVARGHYASSERPIALHVPDGNWHQANKLRYRTPAFRQIPCATLPDAGPSQYRLRAEPRAGGLATLEAIARALRILEGAAGPAIEAALLDVFRVMVERTLWFRGKLHDHEVAGGIPPAALADDPRGAVTRQQLAARG